MKYTACTNVQYFGNVCLIYFAMWTKFSAFSIGYGNDAKMLFTWKPLI